MKKRSRQRGPSPYKHDETVPFVAPFFRHLTCSSLTGPRPTYLSSSYRDDYPWPFWWTPPLTLYALYPFPFVAESEYFSKSLGFLVMAFAIIQVKYIKVQVHIRTWLLANIYESVPYLPVQLWTWKLQCGLIFFFSVFNIRPALLVKEMSSCNRERKCTFVSSHQPSMIYCGKRMIRWMHRR